MDDLISSFLGALLALFVFFAVLEYMQEDRRAPLPLVVYCETDIPENLHAPPAALLP